MRYLIFPSGKYFFVISSNFCAIIRFSQNVKSGGFMTIKTTLPLETELGELFDMKKARQRKDKFLNEEFLAAQKEVKMLILMFSDGIPSIQMPMKDNEYLEWNAEVRKLIYSSGQERSAIESVTKETLVSIRPFLKQLVRAAKEFYLD
jgi:hypothetical protein